MKKVSLILAALALVLGLSQCKKEEKPAQSGEKQHIVLTANNGNDGSKVSADFVSANLNLTWDGDEVITVSGGATGTLHLVSGEEQATATFEGDVTIVDATNTVYFTVGSAPESFAGQTGTETDCATWIQEHNHFVGTSDYQESGNYNVQMNLQYAVLKLDVSALGTSGAMTIDVGGSTVASVTDVASSEGKAVFVAVPADGTPKAYTISCGDKIATKTWTLKKNVFYTKAGAEGAGTGDAIVIKHEFTVGMDGDTPITVEFAPGNLWYGIADGETTNAFHFEENQWNYSEGVWDYMEECYIWVSSHVSHFFWSKDARVGYAANYDEANSQYEITPTTRDVFFTNYDETTANPDFTVNGETGTWRTLSIAEWDYLLARSDGSLKALVTLTDVSVYGLVILPDGTDASVMESITSTSDLATHGAVFLPAAGYRNGSDVSNVGSRGLYWPSTPDDEFEEFVYGVDFSSGSVSTLSSGYRFIGYAVRLVR